jgi:hypothetical protein
LQHNKPFLFLQEADDRFALWAMDDPEAFRNFSPEPDVLQLDALKAVVRGRLEREKAHGATPGGAVVDETDVERRVQQLISNHRKTMADVAPLVNATSATDAWQRLAPVFDMVQRAVASQRAALADGAVVIDGHRVPVLLPFRRRHFEANAMMTEILRLCNLVAPAVSSSSIVLSSPASHVPSSSAVVIPVVFAAESADARAIFASLQRELAVAAYGLRLEPADAGLPSHASAGAFILLLTPGVTAAADRTQFVLNALARRATPMLLAGHGWSFGRGEGRQLQDAHPAVRTMFVDHEALPVRDRPYEWRGLVGEVGRRLVRALAPHRTQPFV